MCKILYGTTVAENIQREIAQRIERLGTSPQLAVILVGNVAASKTYVEAKRRACSKVGIHSQLVAFEATIEEAFLLKEIERLNSDTSIHGILVQLPLPPHINQEHIWDKIAPEKDVDGLHPLNMGKNLLGIDGGFIPCT